MKSDSTSASAKRVKCPVHWTQWIRQHRCACALALTATLTLMLFATQSAQAQAFTVIHSFAGHPTDGATPFAGLVMDANGNLYGTTFTGGSACNPGGCGTVFRLNKERKETVLYSFNGFGDGASPHAGLVMDAKGNLYGTTLSGGTGCGHLGCGGTVFKVSKSGKKTLLHSFSNGTDGAAPQAGLIMDANANLYGTTPLGGNVSCPAGCGTVFKVTKTGKKTVLYSFAGGTDSSRPLAGLVLDSAGNLYGTTSGNAVQGCPDSCGTVFRLDRKGKETVLHTFTGGTDGAGPFAGLVMDAKGDLYGTTAAGGASRVGTVFKLDNKGLETVLYSFAGGTDGERPLAGLVMDGRGNFYGTTARGGTAGFGTVFKVTETGQETVLYSFSGGADGAGPYAGLVMDAKGNLYGTAAGGGIGINGTVFKLTPYHKNPAR
jgi:uncharacterized repeat protein (TIGR03803 family)